jgi:vacuolar iron transporter family protein
MPAQADAARYRANLRAERDAIALYTQLAQAEPNPELGAVYRKLAETEQGHAQTWEAKLRQIGETVPDSSPTWRTRVLGWLARRFGVGLVLPTISEIEQGASKGYDNQPEAQAVGMVEEERSHARVFRYLAGETRGMEGSAVARFEGRHKAAGGNQLRAGVLGANDGLISVFSLVMGVAGANINNPSSRPILLAGIAGLLAGALSMALGEWLSVQSSRELYQHQLDIEKRELAEIPEEEKEELALIYQAKGLPEQAARELADHLLSDPTTALDTLAREELSIDPQELGGSAWEAAFTSFLLFALGAAIPVVPYIFVSGLAGIVASAALSGVGLFLIGAAITLMTGKHPVVSGLRQVMFGLVAAAITFGTGSLIGASIG